MIERQNVKLVFECSEILRQAFNFYYNNFILLFCYYKTTATLVLVFMEANRSVCVLSTLCVLSITVLLCRVIEK